MKGCLESQGGTWLVRQRWCKSDLSDGSYGYSQQLGERQRSDGLAHSHTIFDALQSNHRV